MTNDELQQLTIRAEDDVRALTQGVNVSDVTPEQLCTLRQSLLEIQANALGHLSVLDDAIATPYLDAYDFRDADPDETEGEPWFEDANEAYARTLKTATGGVAVMYLAHRVVTFNPWKAHVFDARNVLDVDGITGWGNTPDEAVNKAVENYNRFVATASRLSAVSMEPKE